MSQSSDESTTEPPEILDSFSQFINTSQDLDSIPNLDFLVQPCKQLIRLFIRDTRMNTVPRRAFLQEMALKLATTFKQDKDISSFLMNLIDTLLKLPNLMIGLLVTKFPFLLETFDTFSSAIDMNRFSNNLTSEIEELITQCFSQYLDQSDTKNLITQLKKELRSLSEFCLSLMVSYYLQGQQLCRSMVEDFITKTDASLIINKHFIIGLLGELSVNIYAAMETQMNNTLFVYSTSKFRRLFTEFVVSNFENLHLTLNAEPVQDLALAVQNLKKEFKDAEDLEYEILKAVMYHLLQVKGTQVNVSRIIHKMTLHDGVLIQGKRDTNYEHIIIHRYNGQVIVTNGKLVPNQWHYGHTSDAQAVYQLFDSSQTINCHSEVEDQAQCVKRDMLPLSQQIQACNPKKKEAQEFTVCTAQINSAGGLFTGPVVSGSLLMTCAAGDIGGSLGYCLANIDRYESRSHFLTHFGIIATINGTMTYLFLTMPLIGQLIALGGLGALTLRIYLSNTASSQAKNSQMTKMVMGTSAWICSCIGGAMLGQYLIPVPILGALIGGFIGGLVAGLSSAYLIRKYNLRRLQSFAKYLEEHQNANGGWDYSTEILDKIGLTLEYFMSQCPASILYQDNKESKWLTVFCYGFLCVFNTMIESQVILKQALQTTKHYSEIQSNCRTEQNSLVSEASTLDLDKQPPIIEDAIEEQEYDLNDKHFIDNCLPHYLAHHTKEEIEPYQTLAIASVWISQQHINVTNALPNIQQTIRTLVENL